MSKYSLSETLNPNYGLNMFKTTMGNNGSGQMVYWIARSERIATIDSHSLALALDRYS